jgi:hypothetical protein
MSINIATLEITRTTPAPVVTRAHGAERAVATAATLEEDAVQVDTIGTEPPDEVKREIASAVDAYDRLAAGGQQIRFSLDPNSGGVSIELQDLCGNVLARLKPSQALNLALGAPGTTG